MRLYTIGHSNHLLNVFVDWLRAHGISQLIDIRRWPGSRRLPQFNQGTLRQGLNAADIDYKWLGSALGGMRACPPDIKGFEALPAGSLRAFAMHINTAEFHNGLAECLELAAIKPTAIMCAERDPAHCHRRLISDYLALQKYDVRHITGPDSLLRHEPDSAARLEGGNIYYDRGTQPDLEL